MPEFPSSCFSLLEMHPLARCRHTLSRRLNPSYAGLVLLFLQLSLVFFFLSSQHLCCRDSAGDHFNQDTLPCWETFSKIFKWSHVPPLDVFIFQSVHMMLPVGRRVGKHSKHHQAWCLRWLESVLGLSKNQLCCPFFNRSKMMLPVWWRVGNHSKTSSGMILRWLELVLTNLETMD